VIVSQVADRSERLIPEDNEISNIMTVVFVDAQAPVFAVDKDLLMLTQTTCLNNVVYPVMPLGARLVVNKSQKIASVVLVRTTNHLLHAQSL
jgi:hypothetical protein